MEASKNSNHNSKTDCSYGSYNNDENLDIYTLDDLIETLEEVANHLITSNLTCE
jgi:hypothetical protein